MTGVAWIFMITSFVIILGAAALVLRKIINNQ